MVSSPSRPGHAPLSNHLRKQNTYVGDALPQSMIPGTNPSGSFLGKTQQPAQPAPIPTMRDKRRCFRERDAIMCPASPPIPEDPLVSEEESLRRSQERIEKMSQRLANIPLYQARYAINLACTQLIGPFGEGCRYWGTTHPIATPPTVRYIFTIAHT
jgi:hypothetical protein